MAIHHALDIQLPDGVEVDFALEWKWCCFGVAREQGKEEGSSAKSTSTQDTSP